VRPRMIRTRTRLYRGWHLLLDSCQIRAGSHEILLQRKHCYSQLRRPLTEKARNGRHFISSLPCRMPAADISG
jgi:hypothetical protein